MSDILVKDKAVGDPTATEPTPHEDLVEWVMSRIENWREVRDSTFRPRWDEYYRIWRGRWSADSRNRRTERSKIISPASQIAVDTAAAELVEAIFAREQFIDLADDIADEQREDAVIIRDRLVEDLKKDGIVETLAEICTIGALYGQFTAKIVTDVETVSRPEVIQDEFGAPSIRKVAKEIVKIYPVAVEPGQLVVDPAGTDIDLMQGCAHEFKMPLHRIRSRQATGTYFDIEVCASSKPDATNSRSENESVEGSSADITEYHGLVPLKMLAGVRGKGDESMESMVKDIDGDEMIEAVVTVANGSTLLRAIANPSVMEDRAVISEQFDIVPNRFWGRSVMEKGYNMQRALDAELRARSDGLAWTNNPMMAGDITKLPPGSDLNVWPGKYWGTKGDPREALMPLQFGTIDGTTFQQAADLERMLQFATGAVDPSVLNAGTRDQATGASAVNVSGIVKRNKRTMLNMEVFLTKLVERVAWRKMQYDTKRYPSDYTFVVRGTVGIMAREVEQQFLIQMLQFVDKGTPEYFAVLQMIADGSAAANKGAMKRVLDSSLQPPSPEEQQMQQMMQQLQMQTAQAQLRKIEAEAAKAEAEAARAGAQAKKTSVEAELVDDELQLGTVKARVDVQQAINQERQISVTEAKQALEEAKFSRGD